MTESFNVVQLLALLQPIQENLLMSKNGIISSQEHQSESHMLTHNQNSLVPYNNQSNPSHYRPILPHFPLQQLGSNQF
ncbi:hypothetical protein RirG_268410 [Rhizophagus irregularis DAOM 197198w]|uniref:Uncharacterized protein n=1 Tax=Rhizophagus irregularis (strain DAOM 197198w) TaxID=1432141 RepID=A0A015JUB7_RHIIW|nr:hypothetical protein RirG_268410 [Rhizophagus irregularis DAOM 197198w]